MVITSCCTSCIFHSCPSHSFQRCPPPHSPSRSRDQEQAGLLGGQETFISTLANFSRSQKPPKDRASPWQNQEVKEVLWEGIFSLFFTPICYSTPTFSRPTHKKRFYISSLHFIEVSYLWEVCVLSLLSNEEALSHFRCLLWFFFFFSFLNKGNTCRRFLRIKYVFQFFLLSHSSSYIPKTWRSNQLIVHFLKIT